MIQEPKKESLIMSHAICAKSGIPFNVQHFPYDFGGMLHHPVFDLSFQQLDTPELLAKYYDTTAFTEVDRKLYFLAMLHSTGLVHWNTYARPSTATCLTNMEALYAFCQWKESILVPVELPYMAVTQDTATLDNVKYWIDAWNNAKADFENGYKQFTVQQAITRKEHNLERVIKDASADQAKLAALLADYAALAADFPTGETLLGTESIPLAEYWKSLIIRCGKGKIAINAMTQDMITDIGELITHIEENLEQGTIYAHAILSLLRGAVKTYDTRFGFTVVEKPTDIEIAQYRNLALQAPASEPIPANYPNRVAYLKAMAAWNCANRKVG